jgi:uncharacterized protein (DUF58 family)
VSGGPIAALRDRLRAREAAWERDRGLVRPTREGGWYLAVLAGVLVAAVNTGNNLLYVILAMLMAIMVVSNLLAEWNLRGLRLRRRLPEELFAEVDAPGAIVVENHRRWGRAFALELRELDAAGGALAEGKVGLVEPGGVAEAPARWRLPTRGPQPLRALRVESRFPFGLLRRWRTLDLPEQVLVFPRPDRGAPPARPAGLGHARPDSRARGGGGDLLGLRDYAPGDAPRDLHWLTTARVGRPVVVLREADSSEELRVVVPPVVGEALEDALRLAAGAVVAGLDAGKAVGLELPGAQLPPRAGPRWRRLLLERLGGYGLGEGA